MSQKIQEPIVITHSNQVPTPAVDPVRFGESDIDSPTAPIPESLTLGDSGAIHESISRYCSDDWSKSRLQHNQQLDMLDDTDDYQEPSGGAVKTNPTAVVQTNLGGDVKANPTAVVPLSHCKDSPKVEKTSSLFKFFKKKFSSSNSSPEAKKVVHTTLPASILAPQSKPRPQTGEVEAKSADGTSVALSSYTGHRRALLIGINYTGHANPLRGCVADTAIMKTFLLDVGFQEENIRVLTDDQVGTEWMPTRDNILQNLTWLIHDAKEGDSYFLHYSGHGGQVIDLDGDEMEGLDNCIYPLDHAEKGPIIDDLLHSMLVQVLPPGVRLTVVFDCCNSGSALDLPYIYASTGYIRGSSALGNLGHELVEGNFGPDELKELQLKWQKLQLEEKEFARQVGLKAADADVIMFSGCKDNQDSADVRFTQGGRSSSFGAMTYAFTKSIQENPMQSYQEMLNNIRELLKDKYTQKPQLSSSRPMDMQMLFHM
ncbi:Ca(2+)-dependent cysteine protease [Podila horticola]|nr:Ca(2+)-dependent cysteine protease [Podila horticola]